MMTHAHENIEGRATAVIATVKSLADQQGHGVNLIAVSKTRTSEEVRAAHRAGLTHFGENYLQDALPKIQALSDLPLEWHFIGRIQTNKTKDIAAAFDWVHTLDRERVAARLNRHRADRPPMNVLIQVNVDDDPSKAGVSLSEPQALNALRESLSAMDNLRVRGLMTILSKNTEPQAGFSALRKLFEQHASTDGWDVLSMGMSGDMEHAIAAGATHIRIGTALFGLRT